MKGAPQDVEGERDTLNTTGRAYFGDHITDERIGETQSHPLYQHLKRLNLDPPSHPCAPKRSNGAHERVGGRNFLFTRNWNNCESFAVIGLAIGGDQGVQVGDIPAGVYRDAVSGNEIHCDGSISFPRPSKFGWDLCA